MAIWLPVLGAVIVVLIVGALTLKANLGVDRAARRELRELRKQARQGAARPLVPGESEMPSPGSGSF